MTSLGKDFQTAIGRWAGLGPYYAMFPIEFTFDVIAEYTRPGQRVLDPFAGRASSIFAAAALGRSGLGIEINPVGWLYGQVKLKPAMKHNVADRIRSVNYVAQNLGQERLSALPEFFSACYTPTVLRFLLAARDVLQWKSSIVDATVMAIILVHLHGKRDQSLSNQMRQGKAMSPDYCVRWWQERGSQPPEVEPVEFLLDRLDWRYAKGTPKLETGKVVLGDSIAALPRVDPEQRFELLFTSPPYYAVTNYYVDQWLRLWMLGGPARPTFNSGKWEKRFHSRPDYRNLLLSVFQGCAAVLSPEAVVYVRTDARPFTFETTLECLQAAFPNKQLQIIERPYTSKTQTELFGDKQQKPGEIDIVMRP